MGVSRATHRPPGRLGPSCGCGGRGPGEVRPASPHGPLPPPPGGILSFLRDSKPGDALCVLGLTRCDLYPCEAWGFTFGAVLPGQGEPAPAPGTPGCPAPPGCHSPACRWPSWLAAPSPPLGLGSAPRPLSRRHSGRAGPSGPVCPEHGWPCPRAPGAEAAPEAPSLCLPQKWASAASPGSQGSCCRGHPAPWTWLQHRRQQTTPRPPCGTEARACASAPWARSSAARWATAGVPGGCMGPETGGQDDGGRAGGAGELPASEGRTRVDSRGALCPALTTRTSLHFRDAKYFAEVTGLSSAGIQIRV